MLLTPEAYGGYVVKGIISVQCFLKWQKSTLFSQQIFWRTKKLCMGKTWQERLNNPGFINRWLRASNIAFLFGGFQHFGQTFVCAQKVVWTCPKLSARIVEGQVGRVVRLEGAGSSLIFVLSVIISRHFIQKITSITIISLDKVIKIRWDKNTVINCQN